MQFWSIIGAALISLAGCMIHGFIGGRIYMRNIRQSDLSPLTMSLSLVSWHMFTIFLLVCAVTLLYIANNPGFEVAAYPFIAANFMGAGLFIGLGLAGHADLARMPGAYLMGATAILALIGVA